MALSIAIFLIIALLSKRDLIACSSNKCTKDICSIGLHDATTVVAPRWDMRDRLPNELRVEVYVYEKRDPSTVLGTEFCFILFETDNSKSIDLMIRMSLKAQTEADWTIAGPAWRTRDYDIGNGNKFTNLPGFYQFVTGYWYSYRYFLDETKTTDDQIKLINTKKHFPVQVDLITNCYISPKGSTNCAALCSGWRTNSTETNAYRVLDNGDETLQPLQFETDSPKMTLTKNNLRIEFQRDPGCENPDNKQNDVHYHFYLHENSQNGNIFKPVIAYLREKVPKKEGNKYPEFKHNIELTTVWNQINLLLKAKGGYKKNFGTAESCLNFRNTFLGDIYPDWGHFYEDNLAVSMTACYKVTSAENPFRCKKWYTHEKIIWDESVKSEYQQYLKTKKQREEEAENKESV